MTKSPHAAVPAFHEAAPVQSGSLTNLVDDLKVHGIEPKILDKVRNEYLNDSGPEATDLFNRMVGGLMSNKLSVSDIQSQAKSVLDDLEDLKKDFDDPDIGGLLNQYGSMLKTFIEQPGAPRSGVGPNSASTVLKPSAPPTK